MGRSIKTVEGGTTIYAVLIGVERGNKAWVRLDGGRAFRIGILNSMKARLRDRLNSVVGLNGTATWRVRDMKMLAFEAEELTAYDPDSMPLTEAFARLASASQGRWEDVDAVEYVDRVRYGIDPDTSSGDAADSGPGDLGGGA
jgi:hypothetical protein